MNRQDVFRLIASLFVSLWLRGPCRFSPATAGALAFSLRHFPLVRQTTKSSAQVTFIEDAKALKNVGEVGAPLRYRGASENAAPNEQAQQAQIDS